MKMWELRQRQALPLDAKIRLSKQRIREWYEYWDGQVYVAFSGGKDSTVMLHLIRLMYPEVPAVFCNTGLEFPEIVNFVKTFDDIEIIRPEISFNKVIEKCGYPILSKLIAMAIHRYRHTNDPIQKKLRLYGGTNPSTGRKQTMGVIPKKYHYLINAPFKISDECCTIMKKKPSKRYERKTKRKVFTGMMATDSLNRKMMYLREGCNSFEKNIKSNPLGFWAEKDIWQYLKLYGIPYSKIYDMGYDRTGCMFCMFGVHLEKPPNRFQRMSQTHPKLYKYCINKLKCGMVLDYIHVDYKPLTTLDDFGKDDSRWFE